jgi:hypothetical protein
MLILHFKSNLSKCMPYTCSFLYGGSDQTWIISIIVIVDRQYQENT